MSASEKSREQLRQLQTEYHIGKEWRERNIEPRLKAIMDEYRLSNFTDVVDWMSENWSDTTPMHLAESDGRIPLLHVMMNRFKALMARDYDIRVSERSHSSQDEAVAFLLDATFDGVREEIQMRRVNRHLIIHAGLEGTGVLYLNYGSEFVPGQEAWAESVPKSVRDPYDPEQILPVGTNVEYSQALSMPGMPGAHLVRIKDIVFDPTTYSLFPHGPARVYHRQRRRVIDVLRDSRLDRKARADFTGESIDGMDWNLLNYDLDWKSKAHFRVGDVIQCYDFFTRQFCQFAPDGERMLLDWTPVPFDLKGKHPYFFWQPVPDPESAYGIPYPMAALPSARAANRASAMSLHQASRDGKKVFVWNAPLVSDDAIERVNMARNGEHIKIDTGNQPWEQVLKEIDFGGANPHLAQLESKFIQNANFASQQTDAARNTFDASRDVTATESLVRQQAQETGLQPMHDSFQELQRDVSQALLQILVQNWGPERIVKYTGNDPRLAFWVKVERERVMRDWNVEVKVGSAQAYDAVTRRQQFNEMVQTSLVLNQAITQDMMAQAQGMPPGPIDWIEMLRMSWEDFDPRVARRVLGRQDPAALLERLLLDHRMRVSGVTPELLEMIRSNALGRMQGDPHAPEDAGMPGAGGMPGMPGGGVANVTPFPGAPQGDFNEQTGIPQAAPGGMDAAQGFSPGMQRGRMMSEMMGARQ